MHGRPRRAPTPEENEYSAVRGVRLRALQNQFIEFHLCKTYTKEAIDVSTKLVELNPEYYTAWNYRKLAVEHMLRDQTDSEYIKSILDEELRVVENALRSNFKSYGAWHHRKWVLSKGHSSAERELLLLKKFQKADARNFHAWNYRRFMTALMNIPDEKELEYTTDMINDNFSNYSAWHYRGVLLSHLLNKKVARFYPKETLLKEEYEFVRNALFTDPDDQSGWFYHLWLLDQTVKVDHLFLSSWPPNGSNICASDHVVLNHYAFPPGSASSFEGFPIILHFSDGVVCVNSSTVTVECEFNSDTNLVWAPVPANKSGCATTWFTYLKFSMKDILPSRHYQVKVSTAHSEGIVSSSGVCLSRPFHIEFGVHVSSPPPKLGEGLETHRIYWSDENFLATELSYEELDSVNRFHQLRINGNDKLETNEMNVDIIAEEISYFRELLAETECKIGKLTLARLLLAHDALSSASHDGYDQHTLPYKEILEIYSELMKMDPSHIQYYKDEYSLVFLKQELTNKESLIRYSYQYKDSSSPQNTTIAGLCLKGLSLSQIGCIERLLWVQMLDLSENELRSIEGLEALQLLRCLNLSKNKFSSFSALEPLRLLKSLQVLDISYNKIGAHPIDTRRYLCASPLSHTTGSDWNKTEQLGLGDLDISTYWDAFSIFKGLNLAQLDIIGNPVVDEKFKYFLRKLLPTMKWLDSEKLG